MGEKLPIKFIQTTRNQRDCWVLLHAANLRHWTEGFTSPPKEGMLRIFGPEKSDGLGTWVTDGSMLTTRPSKPL
jgi:hypothetical protein